MTPPQSNLTLEEKRARVREMLSRQSTPAGFDLEHLPAYARLTYDMAATSSSMEHAESMRFSSWLDEIRADRAYSFEIPRMSGQTTEVEVERDDGLRLRLLNFGSYHYLGYGMHPEVIDAAKAALDRFGLGAAGSPILSGTLALHRRLEQALLDFYDLPDRGVSLFSSGYGVNSGVIPAYIKQGHYVILDRSAHVSIQEGAQLSRAQVLYYHHNDPENLDAVLARIAPERTRMLVCTEGVFSDSGDAGALREICAACKRHGAALLVDEAHSILVAGERGRGACEKEGVLADVDLIVLTFSKGFGGMGGALVARREMTRYMNWYARSRMFSCALAPAVTGGLIKALQLASSEDGVRRRERLHGNAAMLRDLLRPHVDIGNADTWIVPVFYRHGELAIALNDFLQRRGLDINIMQFPAVPKDGARIRMFVTSEHTGEQIRRAARIIREAAEHFGFARTNRS